ncbi:signal recognition particle-docking protein FtsY [Mixta theicola]|uniref:Signal recognition particle receptor FtsY n=1 Tax=Mixta theicola TaxID=1458355 RepID=A0A2K1Q9V6_9GAMM|nr:signal recognition particle-docking protein FtsY [Mixta theicola]PNS11810.1 signal recognition particle-docking protein FtsY [Mixta theicola]GLR07729.1 signal recognition particle receptor FtsY [Mixta theicola]
MAKEKKRGFFSWLGFGREETPVQPEEQKETLTEQTENAAENAEPAAEKPDSEQLAADIVATTEAVAREAQPEEVKTEAVAPPEEILPEESQLADAAAPVEEEVLPEESQPVDAAAPVEEEVLPEETQLVDAAAPVEEEVLPEESQPVDAVAPVEEVLPEVMPPVAAEPVAEILAEATAPAEEKDAAIAAEVAAAVELAPAEEQDDAPLSDEELAALALAEEPEEETEEETQIAAAPVEQDRPTKEGFFARLKRSLVKTRQNLGSGFISLFRGKKIDDELFEELEEQLLIADVGVDTTQRIITSLTQQANRKQLRDAEALYGLLKTDMAGILHKVEAPLDMTGKTPFVILMVGVNGVGKTTTIGKLARQYQAEGKSVMLAAGDTFRAAAVEQLQVWGERNHIPVVAQHTGADSASVIFDAIQAAKARGVDVLIADTAGRLQNKAHLMEELKKITRVMKKLDENAPHEVMLTIDASTGQNAVSQTKLFHEAVGLTGITLTKLDGTAKGGVIFSVADQFGIPIRFIGVGEGIDDLRPFKAEDFIEALFARED